VSDNPVMDAGTYHARFPTLDAVLCHAVTHHRNVRSDSSRRSKLTHLHREFVESSLGPVSHSVTQPLWLRHSKKDLAQYP
jgi:hypothetical protein